MCLGGAQCPPDINLTRDSCGKCGGHNKSCTSEGTSFVFIFLYNIFVLFFITKIIRFFLGICGDGMCNLITNETCENCNMDCGSCKGLFAYKFIDQYYQFFILCTVTCACRLDEECINGVCYCKEGKTGAFCSNGIILNELSKIILLLSFHRK